MTDRQRAPGAPPAPPADEQGRIPNDGYYLVDPQWTFDNGGPADRYNALLRKMLAGYPFGGPALVMSSSSWYGGTWEGETQRLQRIFGTAKADPTLASTTFETRDSYTRTLQFALRPNTGGPLQFPGSMASRAVLATRELLREILWGGWHYCQRSAFDPEIVACQTQCSACERTRCLTLRRPYPCWPALLLNHHVQDRCSRGVIGVHAARTGVPSGSDTGVTSAVTRHRAR